MSHKYMLDEAPEEQYEVKGKAVIVRRDDKAFLPPLPPNAKMAALYQLVKRAAEQGYKKVVMFAKKQQGISYAIGLPVFCREFDLEAIITYPQPKRQWHIAPSFIPSAKHNGNGQQEKLQLIPLHPNMVSINVAQSIKIAEQTGAYFIPFGFDDALSVETHARKFSLPDYRIGTLVTATMTGMILAGLLRQIYLREYLVDNVYGISGGRPVDSVYKSINKYINLDIEAKRIRLHIRNPYDRNFPALAYLEEYFPDCNFFATHPDYEAKAWLWLLQNIHVLPEPIYFINVGR